MIEIAPAFAAEDFGEALTPQLRAREERLRAEAGRPVTPRSTGKGGPPTNDEARVRALLDALSRSIRDKNAAGAIATLAENAVAFDLAPPLRVGPEATHDPAWYEERFATWKGSIGLRSHDLEVIVGSDVAYAYGLQHMTGTKTDGQEVDLWFRATACFRGENGHWRIAHVHNSVPFAMDGSGKALLDLKPAG